jgi:serine/threonine protein phosphatase PrpC
MSQPEILRHYLPDVLSAALIPGRKRPLHGDRGDVHSADALLISRAVPVVAVADGPERNPAAASSFLRKFDEALAASQIRFTENPVDRSFAAVVDLVTELIRTITYHNSTTFSALIPVADGSQSVGIVLHAGDSLILRIERPSGAVTQVSRTSHVLVGRAPALFQTEIIRFSQDDLVVLASDGITDLARTRGVVPAALLSIPDSPRTPDTVVSHIVDSAADTRVRLDDITIICAAVGALAVPVGGPPGARLILT